MFSRISRPRRAIARLVALMSMAWLAACDPVSLGPTGGGGPSIDPAAPVRVALLVPGGSSDPADNLLATNLENAARLAIGDLQGVDIDLRVYNTAGNASQAANVAAQAVNDGAVILVGPLYAEAANAAGVAVAPSNVNVLAFSNNTTIAGGNVFLLGSTFDNTANRLVGYARSQGSRQFLIARGNNLQGGIGAQAITRAVTSNGGSVVGTETYGVSQQGVISAGPQIVAAARAGQADAVITTAGAGDEIALLATVLGDSNTTGAGARPLIGLTRWDASPQSLATPGLQGGYFAFPDPQQVAAFEARYEAAYGARPHPLSGLAYDGIAAVGALAQSGDRSALSRARLTQGAGFQGTSGIFRFRANGTTQRGLAVAQIQNSQVVIVDPAPRSFGGTGF